MIAFEVTKLFPIFFTGLTSFLLIIFYYFIEDKEQTKDGPHYEKNPQYSLS